MKHIWKLTSSAGLLAGVLAAGCSSPPDTLTVAFSNDMVGEIRSCGCRSKDYGGLGRRATFVKIARDTSQNFILLDGGDFFGTTINYGKEKAELTMRSMALMGYDGVVIGEKDLGLGLDFVLEQREKLGLPIVVANLVDAGTDSLIFPPSRTVSLPGGLKVGLIGVMGDRLKLPPQVEQGRVRITGPLEAVRREVGRIEKGTDLIVVLAHMPVQEAQRLAGNVAGVDLVVSGHQGRPMRRLRKMGNAYVVQAPSEGRYMGLAYCVLNADRKIDRFAADVWPLGPQYPDHEAMVKLFRTYDLEIAAREKSGIPDGVATAGRIEKPFVGDEGCRGCHEAIHDKWAETAHAHAFHILEEQGRQYDRDCTPCHTTGFYKLGGFESLVRTPHLVNVQCEGCHGNGHDHAKDPDVETPQNPKTVCTACHNEEQTPGFKFSERWPRIEHGNER